MKIQVWPPPPALALALALWLWLCLSSGSGSGSVSVSASGSAATSGPGSGSGSGSGSSSGFLPALLLLLLLPLCSCLCLSQAQLYTPDSVLVVQCMLPDIVWVVQWIGCFVASRLSLLWRLFFRSDTVFVTYSPCFVSLCVSSTVPLSRCAGFPCRLFWFKLNPRAITESQSPLAHCIARSL